jgi:PAS domain-containing protein
MSLGAEWQTARLRAAALEGRASAEQSPLVAELLEQVGGLIEELRIAVEGATSQQRDLQLARAELAAARQNHREFVELGGEARVLTNRRAEVIAASDAACRMLGVATEEVSGSSMWTLLGTGARADLRAPDDQPGRRRGIVFLLDGQTRRPVLVETTAGITRGTRTYVYWMLTDLTRPLLPGEDIATEDPELARSWLRVYSDLVSVTSSLAERFEENADAAAAMAQPALAEQSLQIEAWLAGLLYRRQLWQNVHGRLTGLSVDRPAGLLRNGSRSTVLTVREAQLIAFLLDHPGTVFSAQALIAGAWHSGFLAPEQLRTYMVRARRRLEEVRAPCSILNQRGSGYRLEFS